MRTCLDWVVMDGSASCVNELPMNRVVETLLDGFESRSFSFDEGDILAVPIEVTAIFTLEKLHNVSPASFNKHVLYFFSDDIVKLHDEFGIWLSKIIVKNSFFGAFANLAKTLYAFFLEPFFKFIEEDVKEQVSRSIHVDSPIGKQDECNLLGCFCRVFPLDKT